MNKKRLPHGITALAFAVFIVLGLASGSSAPAARSTPDQTDAPQGRQQQAAQGTDKTQSQPATASAAQYWTGDGGKNMSLGILPPEGQGLGEDQSYLPALIQGVLVANMSKYSAISVLDRVALDKVITETLNLTYEDNFDIVSLGHVAHVGYMMTGSVIRTSTGFNLQINVTDTTPNARTLAAYSGACTVAEMDDQSAIQKASVDLLEQMGVRLNARAKNELVAVNTRESLNAQTALAQGVTAQRQGAELMAMSYFMQAGSYDPELKEAESRLNTITASISSANTGSDITMRRQWTARLQEAEMFFSDYTGAAQPHYLIYDPDIQQAGVNHQNGTATLNFRMSLVPEGVWASTVNEVIRTVANGLDETGRAAAWGFEWPVKSINTISPFTDVTKNFAVVAEILNDQGRSIARQTVNVPYGFITRNGAITTKPWGGTVSFPGVNDNLITDKLAIRITSIDGVPGENAARQKRIVILPMQEYYQSTGIRAMPEDESLFTVENNGRLTRYNGKQTDVFIPSVVRGIIVSEIGRETFRNKGLTSVIIPTSVTSIGDSAFYENRQLTSVTIPGSVRTIGSSAFQNCQLTSVIIGNSVTSIDYGAFQGNQLTRVTIPGSVTSISYSAFSGNQLTSVTIGAGLDLRYGDYIGSGFDRYYVQNNGRAGTYRKSGDTWTYSAR